MFDDIRELIDLNIHMINRSATIADRMLKYWQTTGNSYSYDKVRCGAGFLFYGSGVEQISENGWKLTHDYILRIGLAEWNEVKLNNVYKILVQPSMYSTVPVYKTPWYFSAEDIPEEELFQNSTVYDDIELCNYYVKMYFRRLATFNLNLYITSNCTGGTTIEAEKKKVQDCLSALEDFDKNVR